MKTSPRESQLARYKRLLPEAMAVQKVAKRAYNAYKSRSKRRRVNPIDNVITNQYDLVNRYKYKRMPKYKRKRWVSAVRKNQFIDQKSQPLLSWAKSLTANVTWISDNQRSFGFTMYPVQLGSAETDVLDIFIKEFGGTTVADQAGRKLFFKSAVLDVQLCNTGAASCIVDVYRIMCKVNWPVSRSVEGIFLDTFGEQTVTGAGSGSADCAVTPFQNPSFCRIYKILSKKEILLSTGQVTTMQMRDPRNRLITGRHLQSEISQLPYITMGYLFQARGIPSGTTTPVLAAGSITIGVQKTYNYALVPGAANKDAVVTI